MYADDSKIIASKNPEKDYFIVSWKRPGITGQNRGEEGS